MAIRRWWLAALLAGVAIAAGIVSWRARHPPEPGPLPIVPCRVTIADPASGLAVVRLELEDEGLRNRRYLILAFADVRGSSRMLRAFGAQVDGRAVETRSEQVNDALVYVVPIGASAKDLIVTYTIDPTYMPPGSEPGEPADARSRISPDLAVVRSASLFPRFVLPGARLGVEFDLPSGWLAVTPWPSADGRVVVPAEADSPVEYIAIGPFETRDVKVESAVVHIVTPALLRTGSFPVESIIARELELVAAPLKRSGPFVAIIVPDDFMHGGAAGDHTIVQSSAPHVLAHEVFHWWNDSVLTSPDAMWFREGLTEYYGIRVAREDGAWTPEAEAACLADLNGEMRQLEEATPRSLRDASLDPGATRLVYSKGALFWLLVDRRLRASGRYLEEAVRRVVTSPREGLTTEELRTLFASMYGGLVDEEFDRYVAGANRLPDLGLGPATGRSGCAKELTQVSRD
jgi:hypothetical protein